MLEKNPNERAKKIELIKGATACTWQHVNFQGTYEFDKEHVSSFGDLKIEQILGMRLD